MRRLDKEVTLCFVDLKKAFVSREKIFGIIGLYDIPPPIISVIDLFTLLPKLNKNL